MKMLRSSAGSRQRNLTLGFMVLLLTYQTVMSQDADRLEVFIPVQPPPGEKGELRRIDVRWVRGFGQRAKMRFVLEQRGTRRYLVVIYVAENPEEPAGQLLSVEQDVRLALEADSAKFIENYARVYGLNEQEQSELQLAASVEIQQLCRRLRGFLKQYDGTEGVNAAFRNPLFNDELSSLSLAIRQCFSTEGSLFARILTRTIAEKIKQESLNSDVKLSNQIAHFAKSARRAAVLSLAQERQLLRLMELEFAGQPLATVKICAQHCLSMNTRPLKAFLTESELAAVKRLCRYLVASPDSL